MNKDPETLAYINSQTNWMTELLHLDQFEREVIRQCWEFWCLGENTNKLVNPSRFIIPRKIIDELFTPSQIPHLDGYILALLAGIRDVYQARMNNFRESITPMDDLMETWTKDVTNDAPIFTSTPTDDTEQIDSDNDHISYGDRVAGDESLCETLSRNHKNFNTIMYYLSNAKKITLKRESDKIGLFRITTHNVGSYKGLEMDLSLLTEYLRKGDALLADIGNRETIIDNAEEINHLEQLFKESYYPPFGMSDIMIGEKKNSFKQRYIYTLYPIVEIFWKGLRFYYPELFGDITKRDIYRFIIKLLEVEDLFSVKYVEQYLKTTPKQISYEFDILLGMVRPKPITPPVIDFSELPF